MIRKYLLAKGNVNIKKYDIPKSGLMGDLFSGAEEGEVERCVKDQRENDLGGGGGA